jgi:hypothetical protein
MNINFKQLVILYILICLGLLVWVSVEGNFKETTPANYAALTSPRYDCVRQMIRRAMLDGWISKAEYRKIFNKKYEIYDDAQNKVVNKDSVKQLLK